MLLKKRVRKRQGRLVISRWRQMQYMAVLSLTAVALSTWLIQNMTGFSLFDEPSKHRPKNLRLSGVIPDARLPLSILLKRHLPFRLQEVSILLKGHPEILTEQNKRFFLAQSGLDQALADNKSLLDINLEQVQRRLAALPLIRSVQLRREFPHRLVMALEIYEPRAILALGKFYYVNQSGEAILQVSGDDSRDFPVISGLSADLMEKYPEVCRRGIQRTLHLLELFSGGGYGVELTDISEIHMKPAFSGLLKEYFRVQKITKSEDKKVLPPYLIDYLQSQWELSLFLSKGGTEIRLATGPISVLEENLKNFQLFLKKFPDERSTFKIFDLRFVDRVVVTPTRS